MGNCFCKQQKDKTDEASQKNKPVLAEQPKQEDSEVQVVTNNGTTVDRPQAGGNKSERKQKSEDQRARNTSGDKDSDKGATESSDSSSSSSSEEKAELKSPKKSNPRSEQTVVKNETTIQATNYYKFGKQCQVNLTVNNKTNQEVPWQPKDREYTGPDTDCSSSPTHFPEGKKPVPKGGRSCFRVDQPDHSNFTEKQIKYLREQMSKVASILRNGDMKGTGFRVGPKYLLTAGHVVQKYICSEGTEDVDPGLLSTLTANFSTSYDGEDGPSFNVVNCQFIKRLDLAVLTLDGRNGSGLDGLPECIVLEKCSVDDITHIACIGFGNKHAQKEKTLDHRRKIILPRDPLIKEARDYISGNWEYFQNKDTDTQEKFLKDYKSCYHKDILMYDGYLEQGSSGGPLLTCGERYAQAVAVVLGAIPDFFYTESFDKKSFPDEYVFMYGVKTSSIYKELIDLRLTELAEDMFRMPYAPAES